MIRVDEGPHGPRMRWDRHDVQQMAIILGAEEAARQRSPLNPAVLRLAARRGVDLSSTARIELAAAVAERRRMKELMARETIRGANLGGRFDHQLVDLDAMAGLGRPAYLLGHRVGAGKTLEAIDFACTVEATRTLVITLNSAKGQWAAAIKRWWWYRQGATAVRLVEGTLAEQAERAATTKRGVVVAHWESLVNVRAAYVGPWDVVIADEAHKAQNHQSQRAEMLKWLAKQARYRLALTAHPFANDPTELFAILRFLYPDVYTSYWRFANMHANMIPKQFGGVEIEGPRRPKLLAWELSAFTLRRTTGLAMPRVTHQRYDVQLSKAARREYEKLKHQFFVELAQLGDDSTRLVIPSELARLTRWRQYLVAPALLHGMQGSAKFEVLYDLLDGLDAPPVIFTSFREAIPLAIRSLRSRWKRALYGVIQGGMQSQDIEDVKRHFVRGNYDALFVVTQAGSEALNLGGHGRVIFLDLPWNARGVEQAIGRVDRPSEITGKVVPTTVARLIVQDSYEETIERLVMRKHRHFRDVFTVGDLKELFG